MIPTVLWVPITMLIGIGMIFGASFLFYKLCKWVYKVQTG